jgi:hypothetical protein
MKRKFIALAIAGCFVSALSHAQIKKGSLLFGGSVGYSSNSQEDVDALDNKTDRKGKVLVLSPSFAMAVADNLFVGADLNWEKGKNTTTYQPTPVRSSAKPITKLLEGAFLFENTGL